MAVRVVAGGVVAVFVSAVFVLAVFGKAVAVSIVSSVVELVGMVRWSQGAVAMCWL